MVKISYAGEMQFHKNVQNHLLKIIQYINISDMHLDHTIDM